MKKEDIRVLLVDDEISLLNAIKKLLLLEGYQVEIATSGKEAIKASSKNHFDIVFLDVNMPELNGLETYKELKKIIPDVPVVMMTGYGRSLRQLIEDALHLGVKSCIDKPFKIQRIFDTIKDHVPHEA